MCNAHFQHLFDVADAADSSSSYSPLEIAQQPIRAHSTEMAQHESSPISAGSVSTESWPYSMDIEPQSQAEAQMYSPVSTSSYSGFHSPIEPSANTRVYALAGALQHQQQPQPQTSFPESSQRSTGTGAYFNEAQPQQAAQRWPYAATTSFAPEMTLTRAPVLHDGRTQAQAPSTSPSLNLTSTSVSVPVSASGDSPTRDQHARIPSLQGAPLPVSIAPHLPNV